MSAVFGERRVHCRVVGLVLAMQIAATIVCAAPPSESCVRAAKDAESRWHLPEGVLQAIGLVETGRFDASIAQHAPWPWSANAGGTGYVFSSLQEAITVVEFLRNRGIASVDVGCFQVNLRDHPTAFTNVAQAFDPNANATYAGRFLHDLYQKYGDWALAIGAYHSSHRELSGPYRDKVMQAWHAWRPAFLMPLPAAASDQHVIRLTDSQPNVVVYTPQTLPPELRRSLNWHGLQ